MGYSVKLDMQPQAVSGFGYFCMWQYPTEAQQERRQENDGFVAAMGEFAVLDYEYAEFIL